MVKALLLVVVTLFTGAFVHASYTGNCEPNEKSGAVYRPYCNSFNDNQPACSANSTLCDWFNTTSSGHGCSARAEVSPGYDAYCASFSENEPACRANARTCVWK